MLYSQPLWSWRPKDQEFKASFNHYNTGDQSGPALWPLLLFVKASERYLYLLRFLSRTVILQSLPGALVRVVTGPVPIRLWCQRCASLESRT